MNLTDDEKSVLVNLVERYKALYENLNKAEEKLNLLDKTRTLLGEQITNLQRDIEETRNIELDITRELIDKYGQFDLDLETYEITIKE